MLLQRFVTAIALLCVFVGGMYLLPRVYWIAFLAPGLFVASMEWAHLTQWQGRWALLYAAVLLASFLALLGGGAAFADGGGLRGGLPLTAGYGAAAIFWLAVVPPWLALGWRTRHPALLAIAGWLVLVPTWLVFAQMQAHPEQSLFILGVVWIADTAAFLVGRQVGRHRLAPAISPGKTWEGVAGAGVAVAVYYAVACAIGWPSEASWNVVEGAIVVAVAAVMSMEGDLFESWMKRQAGVKDSGALLPGHGGLLDRIDGLTASVPVAALLLHVLPARMAG